MAQAIGQSGSIASEHPALPAPKHANVFRIVGIVHPFYINHQYKDRCPDKQEILVGSFIREGKDLFEYMKEEYNAADRMIDRIRKDAASGSCTLVFVGDSATKRDFKKLLKEGTGLFSTHPKDFEGDKYAALKRFNKKFDGHYDELWLLANALNAFGEERVLYFRSYVKQTKAYERLSERVIGATVKGCFMGTYSSQCVTINRNDLCRALNIPFTDIPVLKSAGVDKTWPIPAERREALRKMQDEGGVTPRAWAESRVREYREEDYPGGHTDQHSLFGLSSIRTFLLHRDYFEKTFGMYRFSVLDNTMAGRRQGEGGTGESHFPARVDVADAIASFLGGFYRPGQDIPAAERMPWQASTREADQFETMLANYLAGREIRGEEIRGFAREYQEKAHRIWVESGRVGNKPKTH